MSVMWGPERRQGPSTRPVECPAERATHSALDAADDLRAAVWSAKTVDELRAARDMVEELIERLTATSCDALTLIEHWKD